MSARGLRVVPQNGTGSVVNGTISSGTVNGGTVIKPESWTTRAVCAKQDPDLLFVTGAAQRDAARMCQGCPVRLECLADALDNQVEFGVWGGLTERQRRAILRKSPDVESWMDVLTQARDESTSATAV